MRASGSDGNDACAVNEYSCGFQEVFQNLPTFSPLVKT